MLLSSDSQLHVTFISLQYVCINNLLSWFKNSFLQLFISLHNIHWLSICIINLACINFALIVNNNTEYFSSRLLKMIQFMSSIILNKTARLFLFIFIIKLLIIRLLFINLLLFWFLLISRNIIVVLTMVKIFCDKELFVISLVLISLVIILISEDGLLAFLWSVF